MIKKYSFLYWFILQSVLSFFYIKLKYACITFPGTVDTHVKQCNPHIRPLNVSFTPTRMRKMLKYSQIFHETIVKNRENKDSIALKDDQALY